MSSGGFGIAKLQFGLQTANPDWLPVKKVNERPFGVCGYSQTVEPNVASHNIAESKESLYTSILLKIRKGASFTWK